MPAHASKSATVAFEWQSARLWRQRVGVAVTLALAVVGSKSVAANEPAAAPLGGDLSTVEWPPVLGETTYQVSVAASGHTLGGVMLDYWRATGGLATYGAPISEPFAAANGYYSQAFERGIFQYRPDVLHTTEPIVRLMPIGQTALADRVGGFRADGKRAAGGGDRRAADWRQAPLSPLATEVEGEGRPASDFEVAAPFAGWYARHEGDYYLGAPLSDALTERGRPGQWFEGGLLLDIGNGEVAVAPLPREMVEHLGIDTTATNVAGLPAYDEALFATASNPNPVGDVTAAGPKRIEISLSEQRMWAYQGETLVVSGFVSTGLEPNKTSTGRFHVRYKKPLEDMRGATDAEGNVVWVAGDLEPQPADSLSYGVPDVPDVMYFSLDAEALHGAYWHDAFGTPTSHGCINLPLPMAAFLYGWAPLGTQVIVVE